MNTSRSFRLILASASPRRKQILAEAGYAFECIEPGDAEESITSATTPEALAIAKACIKARVVAERLAPPYPAWVIGMDTLVALGDDVLGKPLDRPDAERILGRLAGSRHRVISGCCLWPVNDPLLAKKALPRQASATTWVRMHPMSQAEIAAYVASGEADGKAGAYAIQENGDRFVADLDGSLLNVVGFPLELFQQMMAEIEVCQSV